MKGFHVNIWESLFVKTLSPHKLTYNSLQLLFLCSDVTVLFVYLVTGKDFIGKQDWLLLIMQGVEMMEVERTLDRSFENQCLLTRINKLQLPSSGINTLVA